MMYGDDMTNKADDDNERLFDMVRVDRKSAGFDPLAARDHFSKGYAAG